MILLIQNMLKCGVNFRGKCKHFLIFFHIFLMQRKYGYLETYKKYYWWDDIHFNKDGNKVIASELVRVLR